MILSIVTFHKVWEKFSGKLSTPFHFTEWYLNEWIMDGNSDIIYKPVTRTIIKIENGDISLMNEEVPMMHICMDETIAIRISRQPL